MLHARTKKQPATSAAQPHYVLANFPLALLSISISISDLYSLSEAFEVHGFPSGNYPQGVTIYSSLSRQDGHPNPQLTMSGRKAVVIKRFGLTQVYSSKDESKSTAMYILSLLYLVVWH